MICLNCCLDLLARSVSPYDDLYRFAEGPGKIGNGTEPSLGTLEIPKISSNAQTTSRFKTRNSKFQISHFAKRSNYVTVQNSKIPKTEENYCSAQNSRSTLSCHVANPVKNQAQ